MMNACLVNRQEEWGLKKGHFLVWMFMIIATILGVFGQNLTYFADEHIVNTNHMVYYLTFFTGISILLYLVTPFLAYLLIKAKKIDKVYTSAYIFGFGMIGICVSLWSFFVCVMWWG
jgi:hypothetical protein